MSEVRELYNALLDPDFQNPYIDIDEWRVRKLSDGSTTSFRYVHGGFSNKGLKFSFCYPAKEQYKGRFYQYLSPFPGPDEEMASLNHQGLDDKIAFCLEHGAYFIETNMASKATFGGSTEPKIILRTSSAAAEYSRKLAIEMYDCDRPFGYVFGGSGGSYKTFSCIENSSAWDGAVPYVIGSPVSLPNTITLHAQGQRTLRGCFAKIVDALDAGGSGDPYEGLTQDEQRMLKEITAMGFPPRAWFIEAIGKIDDGSLPVLAPTIKMMDPQYFDDFWKVDGYLGADPTSSAVKDRLQFDSVVKYVHVPGEAVEGSDEEDATDGRNGVDTAWKKMLYEVEGGWIALEELPQGELYLNGCNICVESGAAAGKKMLLGGIENGVLMIGSCFGMDDLKEVLSSIKPGDKIHLDNSDYIAIQSYYRHQVPDDPAFYAWDQFRREDGTPAIPQRKSVLGASMTGTGGTVQHGDFQGKVIVIQAVMDESTCPWCGDWYCNTVIKAKGSDKDFRIYYMDHCMHGDEDYLGSSRTVNYLGALKQALLDVSDWAERGIEPVPSTRYTVSDGQILLPAKALDRGGIQSVVEVQANGNSCAHVKTGEPVTISVRVEAPHGAGIITRVAYSFKDSTEYVDPNAFTVEAMFRHVYAEHMDDAVVAETEHSYTEPGTYFVSVLAQSSREEEDPYTQIKNLGRARIIVEA